MAPEARSKFGAPTVLFILTDSVIFFSLFEISHNLTFCLAKAFLFFYKIKALYLGSCITIKH